MVLAETRVDGTEERDRLRQAIVTSCVDLIGEAPDEVVLAPPRTVLKTSSGKLRRAATRRRFEEGLERSAAGTAPRQLLRLLGPALWSGLGPAPREAGSWLYTAYARLLFLALTPPVWLVTVLLPRPAWAWRFNHVAARLLLWLGGIGLLRSRAGNLCSTFVRAAS